MPHANGPGDRLPPRDVVLVVLVAVVWGLNFIPIRWALDEIPAFALSSLRFFLAAVPMVVFVRPPTIAKRWVIGYGLTIGVFQFGLLFLAIRLGLAAGLASLLMQMQMFFTMGLARLVTGDQIRERQVVGGVMSFAGLGLLAWSLLEGGAHIGIWPLLLVLAASFAWAVGNVVAKAATKRHDFDMFALVVWSSLVAPLPLAVASYLLEGGRAPMDAVLAASPVAWGSVVFMAYAATLGGYATWNKLLRRHSAGLVSPFTMIVPVVGLASGFFVLNESLSLAQLAGAVTIVAGIWVSFTRAGPRKEMPTSVTFTGPLPTDV